MKEIKYLGLFLLLFCALPLLVDARAKSFNITTDISDKDHCGGNLCVGKADVDYGDYIVSYYIQAQMDGYSCGTHAFACVVNTLNGTNYGKQEIEDYAVSLTPSNPRINASNMHQVFEKYNIEAVDYHEEISNDEAIAIINDAFDKDQVVLFVAKGGKSGCPDLAGSHHSLVLLGTDEEDHVVFIDSARRFPYAQKRTIEQLVKECLTNNNIKHNYYSLITFPNSGNPTTQTGGSTVDVYANGFVGNLYTDDNFTCHTIFLNADGSNTEFKNILDGLFAAVQFLAPTIAIVLTIIDYMKALTNGDTKKANMRTIKRIVIAVIIVFLPLLLDLLFHVFGLYDLNTCQIGK